MSQRALTQQTDNKELVVMKAHCAVTLSRSGSSFQMVHVKMNIFADLNAQVL